MFMLFRMATGTLAAERLPAEFGLLPSTVERMLRAEQVAGLLPIGRPGGGRKGAAHLDALHLAYVMLGCAGSQPSEAPDAVMKLRALPLYSSHNLPKDVGAPLPTLEDQLAHLIYGAGAARRADAKWFPDALAILQSWELEMSLDPLFAVIRAQTSAGESRCVYSVDPTPRPGLHRKTTLSGNVLMAMGELLVDTERQLASDTPSFLDQSRANVNPGNKNAGHPRQEVPASLSAQPTPMGPESRTPRKISAKTKIFKDAPLAGLVTADE